MQKEFLSFYIDDWLLPYEISNSCYLDSNGTRVIEVVTYLPRNIDEVLGRLLKPDAVVAIKTLNGLEAVSFIAKSSKVIESTCSIDELTQVKIRYWERPNEII